MIGITIICINNVKCERYLTIGNHYTVLDFSDSVFGIVDDTNKQNYYKSDRFKILKEYREEQLNKILDN